MSGLNNRQSAIAKAWLSAIHKSGHNPGEVQQRVNAAISRGVPANVAYSQEVTVFLRANPTLNETFNQVAAVIRASDDTTVAKYHAALDRYNETDGADETAINALEPMMRADAVELASRHGITQEAIETGQVDWGAVGSPPPSEGAPTASQPAQSQRFEFKSAVAPAGSMSERFGLGAGKPGTNNRAVAPSSGVGKSMRVAPNSAWSNQVGASASPTGVRVGRSASFDARAERVTIGDAKPLGYE